MHQQRGWLELVPVELLALWSPVKALRKLLPTIQLWWLTPEGISRTALRLVVPSSAAPLRLSCCMFGRSQPLDAFLKDTWGDGLQHDILWAIAIAEAMAVPLMGPRTAAFISWMPNLALRIRHERRLHMGDRRLLHQIVQVEHSCRLECARPKSTSTVG